MVKDRYGFIYKSYDDDCFYFELVEMLKKMLLCSVVILVEPGKLAQLAFAFVVTMFFMAAQMQLMPYLEDSDDSYATSTALSTILTLFAGIVIKARAGSELEETWVESLIINGILFICNVGV